MSALLIIDPPASAAINMATDEYLLSIVDCPILRFYKWDKPTLSIGYFQNHHQLDPEYRYIRRASGGGTVDHSNDLTFSLILPVHHPFIQCRCESYKLINSVIAESLKELGIETSLHNALIDKAVDKRVMTCFTVPNIHDVMSKDGQIKYAGGAQRRKSNGLLHQGSILLDHISIEREILQNKLIEQFSQALKIVFMAYELNEQQEKEVNKLSDEKYASPNWNEKF